jgi:hemolysin activation/secretion protein
LALLVLSQGAFSQQPPSAGSQLRQIPASPVPQRPVPEIRIEQGSAPAIAVPDQMKIVVRSLQVTGAQVFSEAELLAVTGFKPGSELTLADLRAMAAKISAFYRSKGYFVAQAYLPAQDIKDGAVTIAVIEGQYGQIQSFRASGKQPSWRPQQRRSGRHRPAGKPPAAAFRCSRDEREIDPGSRRCRGHLRPDC